MSTVVVIAFVLYFLPTILRALSFALLVVGAGLALNIALAHAQQQTRTTCYDSGNTRICDTFDGMGNPISKTRCYMSGNDTRAATPRASTVAPRCGSGSLFIIVAIKFGIAARGFHAAAGRWRAAASSCRR
jgi:hypothetical protein